MQQLLPLSGTCGSWKQSESANELSFKMKLSLILGEFSVPWNLCYVLAVRSTIVGLSVSISVRMEQYDKS
jgi:hypothetical protein